MVGDRRDSEGFEERRGQDSTDEKVSGGTEHYK